ncbi:hypothetical protein G7B40_033830 [Aetokthonos hydrillicola Thurmond2011]|jgi:hypothetical protein|uniref:Uncharacterized protein n=1 Tax=Aetokthonos hydrillicola Thurmond2011 TaxID=2712845 RepID=A0AAP5IGM6_9CYAN|nr:hypothetical protein [Aetokthonos hydrillicola]MBO3459732.1 hypothetical protein [Aetokthonos hydrillicola CCALA 1050]MBW4585164.1 hypothetical protein [Aetokthonos hydrillicola CCALA 1050]MDR9899503.1 hypothetical protein [Aetokthonos hydrillicola Thurmond2011]
MFLASSAKSIDPQLKKLVDEIEAQSQGLSVLAARQLRYNLSQSPIEVTIKELREFNVLEEFIIRAGLEIVPPPTEDELASVLGLDPVFVRSTTATLKALQTISETSPITITPEGRSFYEKGSVPQPPYSVKIYAIADPLAQKITCQSEPLEKILINYPDLGNFVDIENTSDDITSLSLEEFQQIIQSSGLSLHVPEEGKILSSYRLVGSTETIWKTVSLFVVFDPLEDKLRLQVRSGKKILESASNWLEALQAKGEVSLQALCELSDETISFEREESLNQKNLEIEARLEKIREQAVQSAKPKNKTVVGKAVQLRDAEISQTFSEILNSAQREILIYSPWVSQTLVDAAFLHSLQEVANRGVWILIGYGISSEEENEDKPISSDLEQKLQGIKTPEGLSAVQVFWLGDSHVKEVIVDQNIYLCGSHTWLSYNSDCLPLGESVYKVTILNQVQEAYEFLANRFKNRAEKLWEDAVQDQNIQLATETLCLWGALGMEDTGIFMIQQDKWLELVPVWLNVILQGIRSKKVSVDSASLKTALSMLSEVSGQESFLQSLRQGWCKVMGAIAATDLQVALSLLGDDIWNEFVRLAIAQPDTKTPNDFIAGLTSSKKPKVKGSKKLKS